MKFMWGFLSAWFIIWFLLRLLGWSFGWNEWDWVWTIVYLLAAGFCVTKYQQVKKVY